MTALRHSLRPLLQSLLIVSLIWMGGFLAWASLRAVDFGYPLLYDLQDIGGTIARYGPENRYKRGFEGTDREQRLAIFSAIIDAVHRHGQGLEAIHYTLSDGRSEPFLRQPERIHLRSVARMVDRFRNLSYWAGLVFAGCLLLVYSGQLPLPRTSRVLLWGGVAISVVSAAVLVTGPERVFYAWHQWAFPAGEQWYFYYQDSLMTTLMKAPDLFGGIAVLLLVLAVACVGTLWWGVRRLSARASERGRKEGRGTGAR